VAPDPPEPTSSLVVNPWGEVCYRPAGIQRLEDVTLEHLYEASLMGYWGVYAAHQCRRHELTSYRDRVEVEGKSFDSPSSAAEAITGVPTDGWTFWHVDYGGTPTSLDELRQKVLTLEPKMVATRDLRFDQVPAVDATWGEIAEFALCFDGYEYKDGNERLKGFANEAFARWERSKELPDDLDDLRSALFGEQRRHKWTDMEGDHDHMPYIRALITAIRERVS
jgi:hypothetical protein